MASQAGYAKKVKITTNDLPVKAASLSHGGTILDDTDMVNNAGFRSRVYGLRDWSIQCTCNYDASNTALSAVRAAWLARTTLTPKYLPDGTTGFMGSAVVETFNMSGDVDGLEEVEITFQGKGALGAAS